MGRGEHHSAQLIEVQAWWPSYWPRLNTARQAASDVSIEATRKDYGSLNFRVARKGQIEVK